MIELYTGTPGSGKSLKVCEKIVAWIKHLGQPVVANFEFRASAIKHKKYGSYLYCDNHKLNPDFLVYFSDQYKRIRGWDRVPEEHILLVIDECQILFNARTWQSNDRAGWLSFYTQHRKLGYKVILICQFDRMIDKQMRALVEYEYIHRKVKNIGKGGYLFNLVAGGNLHVVVKVYKPLNEKVGAEFFRGNAYYYSLYDSYTRFSS